MRSGRNRVKIYDLWQWAQEGVWRFLGQYENKNAIKLHGLWLCPMGRHGGLPTGLTLLLHLRKRERHINRFGDHYSQIFFPKWPQTPSKRPLKPFHQQLGTKRSSKNLPKCSLPTFYSHNQFFFFRLHKFLQPYFMAGITECSLNQWLLQKHRVKIKD